MGHFSRQAEPVEEYVSALVVARLSRPDARELLTRRDSPDVDQLQVEAVGIRERLNALAVDFADDVLTASQLRAATERPRSRLSAIEATRSEEHTSALQSLMR